MMVERHIATPAGPEHCGGQFLHQLQHRIDVDLPRHVDEPGTVSFHIPFTMTQEQRPRGQPGRGEHSRQVLEQAAVDHGDDWLWHSADGRSLAFPSFRRST